ncbi:ExbD/TolR family protein [Aquirhabdus parva]|uniref:Biopolymer transporter ExbD n=1 Tax=Aquirhabdus parva TaxID=2283318 RepID=A0A345P2M7_9GAMM|nr:biopolymer transporter ExbD [Aquirhabdus parva]AXI01536.1 biopolymer transporter ExbD [Aquirhabdus parva]
MGFHLGDDTDQGMSEINLIPLIDIMLVLMIIFLVTATIVNPAVKLNLPKADAAVVPDQPEVVTLSIDAAGVIHWNQDVVSLDEVAKRMNAAAQSPTKPSLHLRTDREAKYDTLAQVLARANQAGLTDLAFVSEATH